jgi:hypothetical protein
MEEDGVVPGRKRLREDVSMEEVIQEKDSPGWESAKENEYLEVVEEAELTEEEEEEKRKAFYEELVEFMKRRGTPLPLTPPRIGEKELDFYSLFMLVSFERGGFKAVCNTPNGWLDLAMEVFKLPPNCSNAEQALRTLYAKYIYPFELSLRPEGLAEADKNAEGIANILPSCNDGQSFNLNSLLEATSAGRLNVNNNINRPPYKRLRPSRTPEHYHQQRLVAALVSGSPPFVEWGLNVLTQMTFTSDFMRLTTPILLDNLVAMSEELIDLLQQHERKYLVLSSLDQEEISEKLARLAKIFSNLSCIPGNESAMASHSPTARLLLRLLDACRYDYEVLCDSLDALANIAEHVVVDGTWQEHISNLSALLSESYLNFTTELDEDEGTKYKRKTTKKTKTPIPSHSSSSSESITLNGTGGEGDKKVAGDSGTEEQKSEEEKEGKLKGKEEEGEGKMEEEEDNYDEHRLELRVAEIFFKLSRNASNEILFLRIDSSFFQHLVRILEVYFFSQLLKVKRLQILPSAVSSSSPFGCSTTGHIGLVVLALIFNLSCHQNLQRRLAEETQCLKRLVSFLSSISHEEFEPYSATATATPSSTSSRSTSSSSSSFTTTTASSFSSAAAAASSTSIPSFLAMRLDSAKRASLILLNLSNQPEAVSVLSQFEEVLIVVAFSSLPHSRLVMRILHQVSSSATATEGITTSKLK